MPKRPSTLEVLHPRIGATFALIPLCVGVEIDLLMLAQLTPARGLSGMAAWMSGLILLGHRVPAVAIFGGTLLIWGPWCGGRGEGQSGRS